MVFLNISNQNIIFFFSKLWQPLSHWQWNMKSMVKMKTTPHMPHWLLHLGSALCSYLLPLSSLVVLGGMHFTDQDIPRLIIWWMDSKTSAIAISNFIPESNIFISNRTFLTSLSAHQASMVKPWQDQRNLMCCQIVPKKLRLDITVPKFSQGIKVL